MIMGLFAALLSGGAYGTELDAGDGHARASEDSQFAMAIKIDAFTDINEFKARVDPAIRQIHACRLAPGVERLYAPGELEFLQSEAYVRDGIPLNGVTLADLAMTADKLGADVGNRRQPGAIQWAIAVCCKSNDGRECRGSRGGDRVAMGDRRRQGCLVRCPSWIAGPHEAERGTPSGSGGAR